MNDQEWDAFYKSWKEGQSAKRKKRVVFKWFLGPALIVSGAIMVVRSPEVFFLYTGLGLSIIIEGVFG